ncbi:GNAT family N-acetyltransferase [uncultured Methylobacterium sp.]|jgi:RimJ/RimL family protein N-acetyltransferase|uniref:GNAT family N-acetyltransferase n=1 Tax=uncultured Methylobacterium sp. TaxID=157278 RepID=UPI002628220E|nr:GNAT family N-acetyltransferase [uncultured Methylobacterium sp.]
MAEADPVTRLPVGEPVAVGAAPRPERIVLEGDRVTLAPLDPAAHGDDLAQAVTGPGTEALWPYMGAGPFPERGPFLDHLAACAASEDPLFYAILDRASGRAVGHAALMRIDPANRVIEVGNILYAPALQRRPGATEAMALLAAYVFETLGYRRYEWKCNALNAPSRAAALRLGFRFEGIFRQAMIVKGRNRDTAWFSLLDREWPQAAGAFRRWLAPDNLSGPDPQRLRLSALTAGRITGSDLRRADAADLPALGRMQADAFAGNRALLGVEPLPLLTPASAVLAEHEVWLAGEGDDVAGALVLDPEPGHLTIWSVAVDPRRQGQGLGNRLLAAAENRARDLDLATLRLYTGEPLTRNRDWYTRQGWDTERIEPLADRRLVHMVKHLD